MFESYKYEWKGEEREIGPACLQSHYDAGEWEVASHAMVSQKNPTLYEAVKDSDFFNWVAYAIYLEERYEYLLHLTDSGFSRAGTHPQWVADGIADFWKDNIREELRDYMEWMQEASDEYVRKYHDGQIQV